MKMKIMVVAVILAITYNFGTMADQSARALTDNHSSLGNHAPVVHIHKDDTRPRRYKKNVSMSKLIWNKVIKRSIGWILLTEGIGMIPLSLTVLVGGNIAIQDRQIPVAPLILLGLVSPFSIYGGYVLLRSSYNGERDAFIESYFGIRDPQDL
jgi:hypothetical protein